jgi:hypothetical protein
MRSPRIRIVASSMIPPSAFAIVTTRAPVSATVASGLAAAMSIDSEVPVRGATNFGASSPFGVGTARKSAAVSAV